VNLRDVPGTRAVGWASTRGVVSHDFAAGVIDNLVIVGSAIDDNIRADMPLGVVRPMTHAAVLCGGVGIRFRATLRRKVRTQRIGTPARQTPGRL